MSKTGYSNFSIPSSILQSKDILITIFLIAIAALVAILMNTQVLAGDKKPLPVPNQTVPSQTNIPAATDFNKLDVSQDGKLTRQEAIADEVLTSGFDMVDTDVNGTIDSNEYSVYILTTSPN
jgi:hypothetical protein